MPIVDWFLKTFFYDLWLRKVVADTARKLQGKWVHVSLDDEQDAELLRIASQTGESYECSFKLNYTGITAAEMQRWRASPSDLESVCEAFAETNIGSAKLYLDEDYQALVMELHSTTQDPSTWFSMNRDVVPEFLSEQLKFDAMSTAHFAEFRIRTE